MASETRDGSGLGDDQGTKVGAPKAGDATKGGQHSPAPRASTGMGSEAAEGVHAADGDRASSDASALEGKTTGSERKDAKRAGSEPIPSHKNEHQSKYGGPGVGRRE